MEKAEWRHCSGHCCQVWRKSGESPLQWSPDQKERQAVKIQKYT